jgi:hypothetical protein
MVCEIVQVRYYNCAMSFCKTKHWLTFSLEDGIRKAEVCRVWLYLQQFFFISLFRLRNTHCLNNFKPTSNMHSSQILSAVIVLMLASQQQFVTQTAAIIITTVEPDNYIISTTNLNSYQTGSISAVTSANTRSLTTLAAPWPAAKPNVIVVGYGEYISIALYASIASLGLISNVFVLKIFFSLKV